MAPACNSGVTRASIEDPILASWKTAHAFALIDQWSSSPMDSHAGFELFGQDDDMATAVCGRQSAQLRINF
jgi:hypothetical protein